MSEQRTIDPILSTCHDVRYLVVCPTCKQPGDKRSMAERHGVYQHGRCFVETCGIDSLRALPAKVKGRLTLNDLGPDVMRELLR